MKIPFCFVDDYDDADISDDDYHNGDFDDGDDEGGDGGGGDGCTCSLASGDTTTAR